MPTSNDPRRVRAWEAFDASMHLSRGAHIKYLAEREQDALRAALDAYDAAPVSSEPCDDDCLDTCTTPCECACHQRQAPVLTEEEQEVVRKVHAATPHETVASKVLYVKQLLAIIARLTGQK